MAAYTEQEIRNFVDTKLHNANLSEQELQAMYSMFRGGNAASSVLASMGGTVALRNKLGMTEEEFRNFTAGAGALYGRKDYTTAAGLLGLGAPGSGEQGVDPDKAAADSLAAQLDAFAKEMMGPLNMQDPTTRRIIDDVTAKVGTRNYGSGISGGMADAAVGRGVGDAALGLHAQRQSLGASVMGNRLVDQRQLNMYKDQAARMQLGEQYQNQLAGWESQRGAGQQIGGVLGAIGGGLGGFFLGGPAGAMAGASAGYGMGSGIGGSMSGGPPRAPVYNSPYYGYSSGGGMSSGGRMGY
jgi:hypothetical protein